MTAFRLFSIGASVLALGLAAACSSSESSDDAQSQGGGSQGGAAGKGGASGKGGAAGKAGAAGSTPGTGGAAGTSSATGGAAGSSGSTGGTGSGTGGAAGGVNTGGAAGSADGCGSDGTCQAIEGHQWEGIGAACIPADPSALPACPDGPAGSGCAAGLICIPIGSNSGTFCGNPDGSFPTTGTACSLPDDCLPTETCMNKKCIDTMCNPASCDGSKVSVLFEDNTTHEITYCGCAETCDL